MDTCLVTKLKAIVDNDNLEKLGYFNVGPFTAVGHENEASYHQFSCSFLSSQTLIARNGHFTDSTMTQDLGTTKSVYSAEDIYVSDGTIVEVPKYKLRTLVFAPLASYPVMDIANILYAENIESFVVYNRAKGKLSDISNNTSTFNLNISDNPYITGNVSDAPKGISMFQAYNTNIDGVLSSLDSSYTNLLTIEFGHSGDNGDISQIAPNLTYLSTHGHSVSWNNTRPSNYTIPILDGVGLNDYLGACLKNLANCTALSSGQKYITVYGTYDTTDTELASAIATLRDTKGYTITINDTVI